MSRIEDFTHSAPDFAEWDKGFGVIQHQPETQDWVKTILAWLNEVDLPSKSADPLALLRAADRICSAGMWLVVHETYAKRIRLDNTPLTQADFKASPQGHTGGSLNVVPAYTRSGRTR